MAESLSELMRRMEALAPGVLDPVRLEREVRARDLEFLNPFAKDAQVLALWGFRRYLGDRLIRVAPPGPLLDPKGGPLVAVRLWTLTRKTLGGIQTDLLGRALKPSGEPLAGRRGGRVWRRGDARLQGPRGHLPRGVPLGRPRGCWRG